MFDCTHLMYQNLFQNSTWSKTLIIFLSTTFILILGALHFLDTSVSFSKSFLSDFALGNFGWLFMLSLCLLSVAKVVLAKLVRTVVKPSRLSRAIQFFILFSALTNLLIGVFPTQSGSEVNIVGVLHILFATLSFISTAVFLAMFIFIQKNTLAERLLKLLLYLPYIIVLLMYSFLGSDLKPLAERFLTLFIVLGILLNTSLLTNSSGQFGLSKSKDL